MLVHEMWFLIWLSPTQFIVEKNPFFSSKKAKTAYCGYTECGNGASHWFLKRDFTSDNTFKKASMWQLILYETWDYIQTRSL